jgi:hypothetical protein
VRVEACGKEKNSDARREPLNSIEAVVSECVGGELRLQEGNSA